jgi:tetratricopeptide (TPR) repeat protein
MKTKEVIWIVMLITLVTHSFGQEIPVTANSKEAKKIFIQGREKFENVQVVQASNLFDKAIALDQNFALAHLYRAQTGGDPNTTQKHREMATRLLDKVSDGEKHLIKYILAGADGTEHERKAEIDKLVSMFPNDKRVHTMYGLYLASIDKPIQAAASFNKAIQMDKNYAPAYNLLGYTRMDQKDWAESEKAFKKYIELQPKNPNPYDSYADMLLKSGQLDEALANFRKAYSLDQSFVSALARIGLVHVLKGDFEKARESYRELYAKAPTYNWKMTALNNDAQSYLHEGRFDEAIKKFLSVKNFAKSENQQNGIINTVSDIGWIQMENGSIADAAASIKEARDLTEKADIPDSYRQNQRFFRKIERIDLLMHVNELETAENALTEIKTYVDENPDAEKTGIYYTLVGILERYKGNYDKSLEAFNQSIPGDPYALYQKGLTQELMGDVDGAEATYKEVVNYNFGGMPYAMVRYRAKAKIEAGFVKK